MGKHRLRAGAKPLAIAPPPLGGGTKSKTGGGGGKAQANVEALQSAPATSMQGVQGAPRHLPMLLRCSWHQEGHPTLGCMVHEASNLGTNKQVVCIHQEVQQMAAKRKLGKKFSNYTTKQ